MFIQMKAGREGRLARSSLPPLVVKYSSIRSAGEALDISESSISVYLYRKRTTPFKGIYLFKLI